MGWRAGKQRVDCIVMLAAVLDGGASRLQAIRSDHEKGANHGAWFLLALPRVDATQQKAVTQAVALRRRRITAKPAKAAPIKASEPGSGTPVPGSGGVVTVPARVNNLK